ncbi:hypothetical protein V8C35DRAFT_281836 [Trichoderma chlorosporum]
MSIKSSVVSSISILCLALLSLPSSAQPTVGPLSPKGLDWVLPFVGDWNCFQQAEPNASGGGGSGAGANLTYSIKITKDNVTLDSIQPSPLLTAHSVITYDAENEIFNYTYSDSGDNSGPGTSVSWEEGGHFRFITWPLTNPDRPGIQARTMDDFLRPTSPDQFTDKFYGSQDGGKTWLPAGQLDCTRVPSAH